MPREEERGGSVSRERCGSGNPRGERENSRRTNRLVTAGKALERAIVGGGGTISRDVERDRASTSVLRSGTEKSQLVSLVTTTSSIK